MWSLSLELLLGMLGLISTIHREGESHPVVLKRRYLICGSMGWDNVIPITLQRGFLTRGEGESYPVTLQEGYLLHVLGESHPCNTAEGIPHPWVL